MAVNKVVINTTNGEETLIDLTNDTVTPETLAMGATAHRATGETIYGAMPLIEVVQSSGQSTTAVMSQKAVTDELTSGIDSALAQAKESGEFDGATGQRGTGLLPVTKAPSSYTTAVGGITPKYRMEISTIKTQAGVTEVLLGDTVRYSYYHYPIAYLDASYAYFTTRVSIRGATGASMTITSVSESVVDGGINTVTFSDGTTLNIINGSKGSKGDKGEKGDPGAKGEAGADGKDGLDATPVTPLFANSIEECTDTTKFYVLPDGFIYAYMLTEVIEGDSGGSVAGYTNLVPTSTDTNGSVYNGTGYKENVRLSSSGGVSGSAQNGSVTTGFMSYSSLGVIRIKGATWVHGVDGLHWYIHPYKSDKTSLGAYVSAEGYANGSYVGMSVVYDSATGVTTIDFSGMSSINETRKAFENAVFIRLNAKGKGSDLIVTVNEEIKDVVTPPSEPTEVYQWTSTGHAFVPADYESRILELEDKVEEVDNLKEQLDNILDGTTEIAASTKFDPTVYGLPILYLTGDASPIAVSKDNKVTLTYKYGERSGTCTLKGQGATSYKIAQGLGKYGKYNYTINFDNAFEALDGWGTQKKYCLKANWIDHSHSRNVVSAKLWGAIVKSRSTTNTNLSGLVNGGAVDGFPCVVMLNNEFHGLYTFNIPKDGWMFGMVEDTTKTQAIVAAKDHTTATQFKVASMSGFEVEFASDEENVDWITTSINRLISACINSNGSDLDTTVAQYLDWDSAIDYYILTVILKGTDMVDKNYLLTTFDGIKWLFSAYDMDSTYGLNWDGSGLSRAVSNESFVECAAAHRVWELIKQYKTNALKSRYTTLRSNILSETRICQYFENFAWAIPSPVLMEDVKKYPSIMGSSVNCIDQICRWVRQRLEITDKWIDEL